MSLQRFMMVYNDLSREILGEPPTFPKANKVRKNNVKKCKSCLFYDAQEGYTPVCMRGNYARKVNPLDMACKNYQKKKR